MLDHPIMTQLPPAVLKVWVYCLLRANWRPGTWYDGRTQIQLEPGAFVFSQETMATDCCLSRKQIRTSLKHLQNLGCISIHRAAIRAKSPSLLTVEKWATYQSGELHQGQMLGQQRAIEGPREGHERATDEEYKKERREQQHQGGGELPRLLTEEDWPLTTALVQGRFLSVDAAFMWRFIHAAIQAVVSSGGNAEELTDKNLAWMVDEVFKNPKIYSAGLLLRAVPTMVENLVKRHAREVSR